MGVLGLGASVVSAERGGRGHSQNHFPMGLSSFSEALGLTSSSLSEQQEGGQAAAFPQILFKTSIFQV